MGHLEKKGRSVVWLHGASGSGKTAVALSIADQLRAASRLGGCFFFPHEEPERQSLNCILPTIAYQLGVKFDVAHDAARDAVTKALLRDPGLLGKHRFYAHQVNPLFIEPLRRLRDAWSRGRPQVFVFDGVDKCLPPSEYARIAHFFSLLADRLRAAGLPDFHILLTSHPDVPLQHWRTMRVVDNFQVFNVQDYDYEVHADIAHFLRACFAEIWLRRTVQQPVPSPSEDAIQIIASRAAGSFSFADSIVRLVDDAQPAEQLASILEQCTSDDRTRYNLDNALGTHVDALNSQIDVLDGQDETATLPPAYDD